MIKKTASLIVAQVIGRVLGFFLLIYLANKLGSEVLGAYGTMLTLLMISTVLSTFGMDLWLARHVATFSLTRKSFWKIVVLKTGFTLFILFIFGLAFYNGLVLASLLEYKVSVALILSSILFDHVGITSQSVLEGRRDLVSIAKLIVLRWGVFSVTGVMALYFQASFEFFCLGFLVGAIVRAWWSLVLLRPFLEQKGDTLSSKQILREAAPMAFLNTMVGLYFHIDMLMIPHFDSLQGAGFYKTAYSMVEALLFLSGAVASSLYPIFSDQKVHFDIKWEHFVRGAYLLMLLAFPISFCTPFVSGWLIEILFLNAERALEFSQAAPALNILVWALPAMFLNSSLVRLFLGTHHQLAALLGVSITALVNVVMNLFLLPRIGFMGAAYSTVCSEVVLSGFLWIILVREGHRVSCWRPLLLPMAVSSVAWFFAWTLRRFEPVFLISLTVLGFGGVLWVSGLLTRKHFQAFGKVE